MTTPETLPSALRRHASVTPDASAILVAGAKPITYGALEACIATLGCQLRDAGLGREARVAIQMATGDTLALAILGVMSHAVAVPIDPKLTEKELVDLHGRLQFDALMSPRRETVLSELSDCRQLRGDGWNGMHLCINHLPSRRAGPQRPEQSDDFAVIYRTSGTTALPKLVPVTHGNFASRIERLRRWLALSSADRALAVGKLHYSHGLETSLLAPLGAGGSVAFPPEPEQELQESDVVAWLTGLKPTYYSAGPTFQLHVLDRLTAHGRKIQHHLRFVQTGGAPLAESVRQALQETLGVPVLDAFGLSETGQLASNSCDAKGRKPGTVGRPDNDVIALLRDDGSVAQTGGSGEVVVRGASVAPGYLDASGELQSILVEGWFRTGDLGALDTDRFLTIAGRLKDIINRGGEKIAPAEIDQALLTHPDIIEAAAFSVAHPRLGEDVAAAVVLRAGAATTPLEVRRHLGSKLAPFKVPRVIHVVNQLPKGPSGKLSRAMLTQQYEVRSAPALIGGVARSGLEHEIASVWERLLKLNRVGPMDDFFELGGDSLLAVQMLTDLEALVGRKLPDSLLFDAATVRQLADVIVAGDHGSDCKFLRLNPTGTALPLVVFDGDLNGGGYYVRRLAAGIGEDRPLWVMRPFDAAESSPPPIEQMANYYLSVLRQEGLKPPFMFCGYCNGALIALEVAHQAEMAGDEVGLVMMIDPVSFNARRSFRALRCVVGRVLSMTTNDADQSQRRLDVAMAFAWDMVSLPWYTMKQLASRLVNGPRPAVSISPYERRMTAYHLAMARHLPSPVKATLVCFTPEASLKQAQFSSAPWRRFGSGFQAITVPGGHLSCVSREAGALAGHLRSLLQLR